MSGKVTDEAIAKARQAASEADAVEPRAAEARYDVRSKRLIIKLRNGVVLQIPVRLLQGVAGGTAQQISEVEIWGDGYALHWEELDADITVPGLARGIFGTQKWMEDLQSAAAILGRKGGRVRSDVKTTAVRANGRKGGRPRKKTVTA